MSAGLARNPYDFRRPIGTMARLAGRDAEREQIDELLRGAALGSPSHFSLFGPAGMGKSSLLNVVGQIARRRNLLPVKLDLREATVESLLTFYFAVFDAAVNSLVDLGAIEREHCAVKSWTQHTLLGDTDHASDPDCSLATGLLVAARMSGKVVNDVPTTVLARDIALLLTLGESKNVRGIVLKLDNAGFLDDNRELAPSIMELAESTPSLTIVTAAEEAGCLQEAAPRAWTQIEVTPFRGAVDTLDAIMKPLVDAEEIELAPSLQTAQEIHDLTEGRPYEVNLVNHFVWEAITQGDQAEFKLSEAVLSRVLYELEQRGRHTASSSVSAIRNLTDDDLRAIAKLAPFEGLTIRQLALGRLMFNEFDEDRLGEVEGEITTQLQRLASLGILRLDHDLFEIEGGPESRLYLRYSAEQRVDTKIEYGDTYARLATGVCRRSLSDELLGPDNLDMLLLGFWSRRELGAGGGRWLDVVADSVREESLSDLSDLLPGFDNLEHLASFTEKGGLLFGFGLQVGLQNVEYADIAINVQGLSAEGATERINTWIEAHEPLLSKYEIAFQNIRCERLSPTASKNAAAFSELRRHCMLVYFMHRSGFIDPAIEVMSDCVDRSEALIGSEPADPLVRAELADAINRLGFLHATAENWDKAAENLKRSIRISIAEEWLPRSNLSFIEASRGDFEGALALAEEAKVLFTGSGEGETILHAWFPTPASWKPEAPRSAVVSVHGKWLQRFVELQTQVYAAKTDPKRLPELRKSLDSISLSAPPAFLRMAGWCEYTMFDSPSAAAELFDHAIHATDLEEISAVEAEHRFVVDSLDPDNEGLPEPGSADLEDRSSV